MVGASINLVLGEDEVARNQRIAYIKERFVAGIGNLGEFNTEDIDAGKLSIKGLQEALKRLPVESKGRLLIIRNLEEISEKVSVYLLKNIDQIRKNHFCLVLSVSSIKDKPANKLITHLEKSKGVNRIYCRLKQRERVFDLARHIIDYGNAFSSLSILRQLLLDGKEPTQILGGLFWYWNNGLDRKLSRDIEKDLQIFLATDTEIKRGKVAPGLALELLIVKLCQMPR